MQRAPAVSGVRITDEVGIFAPLIQERRKVAWYSARKKYPSLGRRLNEGAKRATKRAVLLGTMPVANFVATAARDGQSTRLGDGLDECRLAGAILPDEVRDRALEGQVEALDEGNCTGTFRFRHALGDDVDAFEEQGGRRASASRSHRMSLMRVSPRSSGPPKGAGTDLGALLLRCHHA